MLPLFRTISVGGVLLAITIFALAISPPGGSRLQSSALMAPANGPLLDRNDHPEWRQSLILAAVRRAGEIDRLRELPDTPTRVPAVITVEPETLPPEAAQEPPAPQPAIAGLPAARSDADPVPTGSVDTHEDATIPVDIGETSSTELPVLPVEETPPAVTIPEAVRSPEPEPAPEANSDAKIDARTDSKTEARIDAQPEAKPAVQAKPAQQAVHLSPSRRTRTQAAAKPQAAATAEVPIPFNLLQAFFNSLMVGTPEAANKAAAASKPAATRRPAAARNRASRVTSR